MFYGFYKAKNLILVQRMIFMICFALFQQNWRGFFFKFFQLSEKASDHGFIPV